MKQPWQAIGLGAIAFVVGFGVSSAIERDVRKASVFGLVALAGTSAGVIATNGRVQAAASSNSERGFSATPRSVASLAKGSRQAGTASNSDVAVFWDYENIKASFQGGRAPLAEALVNYATELGSVRTKMIYSNWRREHEKTSRFFYSLGFEPIHVDMGKANSVDLKLAVDSLSIAYQNPDIETFILVTGDKDFVPLVNGLKDAGKTVVLASKASTTSSHLLSSADEFVDISTLVGEQSGNDREVADSITYRDAAVCLKTAVQVGIERGKSTRLPAVDLRMRSNRDYTYRGYQSIATSAHKSFSNFSDFVRSVQKEGGVVLKTVDGFKEIGLPVQDNELPASSTDRKTVNRVPEQQIVDPHTTEQQTTADLTEGDWRLIVDRIRAAFAEVEPGATYGRYLILLAFIRMAKKDGRLPYPNRVLENALQAIVDDGLLVVQPDDSYRLTERIDEQLDTFLQVRLSPVLSEIPASS
ncbi:MAG: NYN domain-containing protein [Cyanobacteria bacterium P01_A01_bin.3]